jgi:cytochrome b561
MIAANGRRLFAFLDEGFDENRAIAAQWGTALVVVVVGIVGLLRDSGTKSIPESWLNVHALFGLLLCVSITTRFYRGMKHPALVPSIDIDVFTRHVSRMVYLLLYGLLGAKQIIDIATFLLHGGGFDFHRTILTPIEDFQVYVAYGMLALMLNQALAAVWRHSRQTRVAPVSTPL